MGADRVREQSAAPRRMARSMLAESGTSSVAEARKASATQTGCYGAEQSKDQYVTETLKIYSILPQSVGHGTECPKMHVPPVRVQPTCHGLVFEKVQSKQARKCPEQWCKMMRNGRMRIPFVLFLIFLSPTQADFYYPDFATVCDPAFPCSPDFE
eukprot:3932037-Rhodomonas_salina.1